MSQVRTFARQAIQTIKAPLPKGEGTLYVEGVPALRMDDREGVRRLVAGYCLRVALERGCSRIVVRHPHRAPIGFDVVELLVGTVKHIGYWPVPKMRRVPANIATVGMLNYGAEMAPVRPQVAYPINPLTPVFGSESDGKETT